MRPTATILARLSFTTQIKQIEAILSERGVLTPKDFEVLRMSPQAVAKRVFDLKQRKGYDIASAKLDPKDRRATSYCLIAFPPEPEPVAKPRRSRKRKS